MSASDLFQNLSIGGTEIINRELQSRLIKSESSTIQSVLLRKLA